MANGPNVQITVTFHPPDRLQVVPERAKVDWGKKEGARWRLASSDSGAVLEKPFFQGADPDGPFGTLTQDPSDPGSWIGSECEHVTAEFKYDVTVTDGEGKKVTLDPLIATGNPPP